MTDYIALIRRKPSLRAAAGLMRDLRDLRQANQSALVFFHGDGVETACDRAGWPGANPDVENPDIEWCVCRTSLERRSPSGELPPSFRVATLMRFYQAVVSARRVDSLGIGGSLCWRPEPAGRREEGPQAVLLEVGFAATDERRRRETLEMALGAAALELDASVLFHGDGIEHLAGESARSWAQITDYDLLGMYAQAPARSCASRVAVQHVTAAQAAELRARAATILIL